MKKVIKGILAVVFICFGAAQITHAQTLGEFRKMPVEQKAKLVADSMKVMLTLTDAQYDKAYAIVIDAVTKAQPIAKNDDSRVERGKKVRELLREEEAKLKQILTQQQFTVFQAKKQNAVAYYRQHIADEKLVFNVPG